MHHGMGRESIFGESLGCFDKCANAVDVVAHLIFAGPEHGSLYLNHVLEAWDDAVNAYRVVVGHLERRHVELVDVVDAVLLASLSYQPYRLGVGIAGKSACVAKQRFQAFALLHLVVHRALHLAFDAYETVVCSHYNHVVVGQLHVAS